MSSTISKTDLQADSIHFLNEQHRQFYYQMSAQTVNSSCYQKSILYLLGLTADTRKHFSQIYDIKTGCIRPECLSMGWQTEGSRKIIRLAFNLYTDKTFLDIYNKEDILSESIRYSVSNIFCCRYAPYFGKA